MYKLVKKANGFGSDTLGDTQKDVEAEVLVDLLANGVAEL